MDSRFQALRREYLKLSRGAVAIAAAGVPGQGFTWRGTWDSGTAYVAYDVVHYNGSAYVATAASTNEAPATSSPDPWDLFASEGAAGGVGSMLDYVFVRRTSQKDMTTDTALAADGVLKFAIGAAESWKFRMVLFHQGTETNDIKIAMSGPASCTGTWGASGPHSTSAAGDRDFTGQGFTTWDGSTSLSFGNVSTLITVTILEGVVHGGGTPGDVELYWAQNVSSTTTSMLVNSHLEAIRVA